MSLEGIPNCGAEKMKKRQRPVCARFGMFVTRREPPALSPLHNSMAWNIGALSCPYLILCSCSTTGFSKRGFCKQAGLFSTLMLV